MPQILQFRHLVVGAAIGAIATLCPILVSASSAPYLDQGLETHSILAFIPAHCQEVGPLAWQPRETHGVREKFTWPGGGAVYFDVARTSLVPSSRNELVGLACWLSMAPASRVTIEGRTDDLGTRAYNLQLGFKRAARVRDFLISRGVAASRILIISFGSDDFAPRCNDAQGRYLRRNARITVDAQQTVGIENLNCGDAHTHRVSPLVSG